MAVQNATFSLTISPRVTGGDVTMPKGVWMGRATVTGDATGGAATCIIQLPPDDVYSWEGLSVVREAGTNGECAVLWIPQSHRGEGVLGDYTFNLPLDVLGSTMRALGRDVAGLSGFPISWAEPGAPNFGVPPELRGSFENTDTVVVILEAWGYQWDVSVKAIGSPQRP